MLLPYTKILVLDDEPKEVKKLLYLLNKEGLSFNYYKSYTELPKKPLTGVRLLFLDFELETDGLSDKNKISKLMRFIKKTISENNGPYIIVAWTQYDGLISLFKSEIMKGNYILPPLAIINLDKSDCMNSLLKIKRKIKEKMNDKQLIEILLQWENNACNSSSDVLKCLADLSKPEMQSTQPFDVFSLLWNSQLEKHMYLLSKSNLGKQIKPNKHLIVSAQFSFIPVFQDYIETRIKKDTKLFNNLSKKIYKAGTGSLSIEKNALMTTTFLLVTKYLAGYLHPGNIYIMNDIFKIIECEKKGCYFNSIKPKKRKIVEDFYGGNLGHFSKRIKLGRKIKVILMEITPLCDYTQRNMKFGKFVLGVLWPASLDGEDMGKKIKKVGGCIYKKLPILYDKEIYYLTFNSRYFYNFNSNLFNKVKPLFRARKELLVDVQHWFSTQISRPGKTEF